MEMYLFSKNAMYLSIGGYFVREYLLFYVFKQKQISILRKREKTCNEGEGDA